MPVSTKAKGKVTWEHISRGVGLAMILILFLTFIVSIFVPSMEIERTLALTFLGIATTLIGIPSGLRLIVSRNGSTGSQ